MSISLLLDMAASNAPDQVAVVSGESRWTGAELDALAHGGAGAIAASGARSVAYVGTGGALLPLLIFASARAGVPFTPVNYRLGHDKIAELVHRLDAPLVIHDEPYATAVAGTADQLCESADFLDRARRGEAAGAEPDPDDPAVVLFTSGTTSQPKAVELSHNNLVSYITGTVEFASAADDDIALICVPPYHVAGVTAALSNLYAGRRMVYLRHFDPAEWIRLVETERVTTATVVPTMLDRIVSGLRDSGSRLPTLRTLAYGGSKVALPLVRTALELLPEVGFVNAYGLTETSSTIAVLGPEDHRAALASADEKVARRLGSVGRPVPGIEVEIRDEGGAVLPAEAKGELFVRGPQVSGRYTGIGSVLDAHGWFPTKDLAVLDAEGYLFVHGRSDDTIIRGGENIAPAEIEDVLVEHPGVRDTAVVGVADAEWGQIIVAVVVAADAAALPDPEELRAYVRSELRGSRTPDRVVFRSELPATPTGKILRRELVAELTPETAGA